MTKNIELEVDLFSKPGTTWKAVCKHLQQQFWEEIAPVKFNKKKEDKWLRYGSFKRKRKRKRKGKGHSDYLLDITAIGLLNFRVELFCL